MASTLKNYSPLLIVVTLVIAMSLAVQGNKEQFCLSMFMNSAMGFFLCILSMFKLFDITGFVEGFNMYDIITKRFLAYGYVYPFIELGLGLSYLSHTAPFYTNVVTLILMTISSIGVIKSITSGMDVRCACLGTVLKVPLSTVSIVENAGMGIMAAMNIIFDFVL